MGRVCIRLAKREDCRALAELRYNFRAELGKTNETRSAFVKRCSGWMGPRFQSGTWQCWVAENGTRLIGHACVHLFEKIPNPVNEPEAHAYVTNCYVVPELRNAGVGKRLISQALSWCRRQGVDAVILWPSPASKSFYRRAGFALPSEICELRPRPGRTRSGRRSKN